ncbi:MAG: hypothetical protein ABFS12_07975 [Bacteroidota bacterium]
MIKTVTYIVRITIIFIYTLLVISCSETKVEDGYVLQLEDVGLRKGIFERRFKLTKDYGSNKELTPEILKGFIDRVLLQEYLFIQKSFDLGFDKDPEIKKNHFEFKMNALASNHPILHKQLFISNSDLQNYYKKKNVVYDLTVIQHNSYYQIDSIYHHMTSGKVLKIEEKRMPNAYPRKITYNNHSFGESLPGEIYRQLPTMEEGDISEPIYTAPFWVIIKLNKKEKKALKEPIEGKRESLLKELEALKKKEQIKKYTDSLKVKYKLKIADVDYTELIQSVEIYEGCGLFIKDKFTGSIDDILITTSEEEISIDMFFYFFNRLNQYEKIKNIVHEDIEVFINDLASQMALYIDALKLGVGEYETLSEQIQHKLNKALYRRFLKEEISDKVKITQEEARRYYESNRDRWSGEFENVKINVISDLKTELMHKYSNNLVEELSEEYDVLYNEPLLQELADRFTEEKKGNKNSN